MAFISATASQIANGGGSSVGGYLTASKLKDGEHHRIAIVSENPLEYWTVWGESAQGQKKPFRFIAEPSAADITEELGDFTQRLNYAGTAVEAPKFALSFFCFDFKDAKIKVFEVSQKTLIKELDKLSHDEDYADLHAWDLKFCRTGTGMETEYSILPSPRKKGSQEAIDAAWEQAKGAGYDLTRLLDGGNPFSAD